MPTIVKTDRLLKVYLASVAFLLPMDWFAPTGSLFREFGAKPAVPLLTCGSVLIVILLRHAVLRLTRPVVCASTLLAFIAVSGTVAFSLNLIFRWSNFAKDKDPSFQFFAQSALFVAFAIAVLCHAVLFQEEKWRSYFLKMLPWVAVLNLTVIFLEMATIIPHDHGWLLLFRTAASSSLDRDSGLMSEPSYFGAFAALFGFPLIFIKTEYKSAVQRLLGVGLFVVAAWIHARTVVPVLVSETVVMAWRRGRSALRPKYILGGSVLLVICAVFIVSTAALDIQENLSTINRLGSTQLALNVASRGYGITGVGFGQFHFFYSEKYAPQFVLASDEALAQMSGTVGMRASTFNLFARVFLESGFVGISMFLVLLFSAARSVLRMKDPTVVLGLMMLGGSVGFLCTGDFYFYPPLAIALGLLIGSAGQSTPKEQKVLPSPVLPTPDIYQKPVLAG